jgi:hypothetical protein
VHPYLPLPFGPSGHGPRLMQFNDVLVAPLRLISQPHIPSSAADLPKPLAKHQGRLAKCYCRLQSPDWAWLCLLAHTDEVPRSILHMPRLLMSTDCLPESDSMSVSGALRISPNRCGAPRSAKRPG